MSGCCDIFLGYLLIRGPSWCGLCKDKYKETEEGWTPARWGNSSWSIHVRPSSMTLVWRPILKPLFFFLWGVVSSIFIVKMCRVTLFNALFISFATSIAWEKVCGCLKPFTMCCMTSICNAVTGSKTMLCGWEGHLVGVLWIRQGEAWGFGGFKDGLHFPMFPEVWDFVVLPLVKDI